MITFLNKSCFADRADLFNVIEQGDEKTSHETFEIYTDLLIKCGFIKQHTEWLETEFGEIPDFGFKLLWFIPEDFSLKEARMWAKLGRPIPWFIHPEGKVDLEEKQNDVANYN